MGQKNQMNFVSGGVPRTGAATRYEVQRPGWRLAPAGGEGGAVADPEMCRRHDAYA